MVASLLVLSPSQARAADEERAPLDVRLGLNGNIVNASFDVTNAFPDSFRKRLGGGLTSRVLIEMELIDAFSNTIAVTVRACQLRLDIWEDVFLVAVTDEQRSRLKTYPRYDDAVRACGRADHVALGQRTLLTRANGYRLIVRVALNPVSQEVLDRTREFMSDPRGTGAAEGRHRAFFGAVAKLFRSDARTSGERFAFQSQVLARPSKEGP